MTTPARLVHFRWDLDKTYLRTDFDTLRDLVRTFRAPAEARAGQSSSHLATEK